MSRMIMKSMVKDSMMSVLLGKNNLKNKNNCPWKRSPEKKTDGVYNMRGKWCALSAGIALIEVYHIEREKKIPPVHHL